MKLSKEEVIWRINVLAQLWGKSEINKFADELGERLFLDDVFEGIHRPHGK